MDAETVSPSPASPAEALVKESPPPASPKRNVLVPVLTVVVLIVVAFLGYRYRARLFPPTSPSAAMTTASATPTAAPLATKPTYAPVAGAANMLAYVRDPDPQAGDHYQVWLIDPATGKEQQLPLTGVYSAFKHYGSPLLYYQPGADPGKETGAGYRVLDLSTGTEQSYNLVTHPDPTAGVMVQVANENEISPDGKWMVFQASFYAPCPSPSPLPSGLKGGYGGPCSPPESLIAPDGYYLYDFTTRSATPLGDLIQISRWDMTTGKLYYVATSISYALDLQAKTQTIVDSSSEFGYFTYPLLKKDLLVKNEGATDDTPDKQAFGRDDLYTLSTDQKVKTIEEVVGWAVLQPFITSSPDDENVFYTKTSDIQGYQHDSIIMYNVAADKTTTLAVADDNTSYSPILTWLNNHTFVTTVYFTGPDVKYTTNNYIVKIDTETGSLVRLTNGNTVAHFNML